MDVSSVATAAVVNGVLTGGTFYLLDTRLSGYSPWQKAAIASAAGTAGLSVIVTILSR